MTDPQGPPEPNEYDGPEMVEPVEALGRQVVRRWQEMLQSASPSWAPTVTLGRALRSVKRLRLDLRRAPCIRHRHHRDAHRRAHRVPDQRDHRLHERPAAAALRRGDLRRGPGHDRSAARAGGAADRDHRGRPLGQRVRRRDRRHAAQRGGGCARGHRCRSLRGAGRAAHPRAGDRPAAADADRRSRRAHWAARSCAACCSTCRSPSTSGA